MVRALCMYVPYLDVRYLGFDFENLGNIEFFVIQVGLWDAASLFLIQD